MANAATAMGCRGEFNIGELCRTAYGNDAVLIGFGTVAAADHFEGVAADQLDTFVWFEETHAVTPLGAEPPQGAPDTCQFGL
jgi:hypothetical protein